MSQSAPGDLDTVTKSAVMKMLATPGMAKSCWANSSSGSVPPTYVAGPPTGTPQVNLRAFGLGVGETVIGTPGGYPSPWAGRDAGSPNGLRFNTPSDGRV